MSTKKSRKAWMTALFVLTVLLIAAAAVVYLQVASREKYKDQRYTLYFLDGESQSVIRSEERYLFPDSPEDLPRQLIAALLAGPEDEQLASPFPKNLRLQQISLTGDVLSVDFSQLYGEAEPYMRNLADCCLLLTVSQLGEINAVELSVNGQIQYGGERLTKERFIIEDTFFESSPIELRLYYPSTDLSELQDFRYPCTIYADRTEAEMVLELLEDRVFPVQTFYPLPDPFVRSVSISDGTAHVDLAKAFLIELPDAGGSPQNTIFLHAIVRSLSELQKVNNVMFTFDGETVGRYGELDLSTPLTAQDFS